MTLKLLKLRLYKHDFQGDFFHLPYVYGYYCCLGVLCWDSNILIFVIIVLKNDFLECSVISSYLGHINSEEGIISKTVTSGGFNWMLQLLYLNLIEIRQGSKSKVHDKTWEICLKLCLLEILFINIISFLI